MKMLLPVMFCLAAPLAAQEWSVRDGDVVLTPAELATMIPGNTLVFFDDGRSKFSVGGAYSYTYANGATAFGQFNFGDEGTICVHYRNGRSRCDRYVLHGSRLILLTEHGQRFPVRDRLQN